MGSAAGFYAGLCKPGDFVLYYTQKEMKRIMLDILTDAVMDSLKTLPFLFGAYLLIEFLEHRASGHMTRLLARLGPLGPLGGATLGCVPQCGFSVAAANFYAGRLITPGTLIAVFLSTSDEALPILLSRPGAAGNLWPLLGVKLCAGALTGIAADLVYSRFLKQKLREPFHELCEDCGCEEKGVLRSALGHTVKIFLFLLAVNIALGCAIELVGGENISRLLLHGSVFQPLLAGLIGFIPNCAASVILTELYLEGSLSFGAAVAGLCTGAGLGLLVLFRVNKNWRENLCIAGVLYVAAVVTGTLCQLVMP